MSTFIRTLLLIISNCACYYSFAQQKIFGWVDDKTNLHWQIDIRSHILQREVSLNHWQNESTVIIADSTFKELPRTVLTNSFPSNGKIYFTVIGTGQVYRFDPISNTVARLDKTYYRGYNFNSCQFIRKDTIYSFGGSGFWQFNSILTYYDWTLKEWEWIHSNNNGPRSITYYFNGYDATKDVFYSALNPDINDYGERKVKRDSRVFALDLKSKTWKQLGVVDDSEIFNIDEPVVWSGRYFFQCNDNFLLIIDPEENKILKYDDGKSIFSHILDVNNEFLIVKYTKFNNNYVRESFQIQDIIKNSKYIKPFYTKKSISWTWYLVLSTIIIVLIVTSIYIFQKKKVIISFIDKKKFHIDFNDVELIVLKALTTDGKSSTLNTLELNSILNIDEKSPDNQRKLRNNFISDLNKKIAVKYKVLNCIDRKQLNEDKRLTLYYLKETDLDLIKKAISSLKKEKQMA